MDGNAISMHYLAMNELDALRTAIREQVHLDSNGEYRDMPEHYMARDHPINDLVIWVLAGRGFAETEGERVEAQAGDLLVFRRGRAHRYGADPKQPWHIVWLHLGGQLAVLYADAIRGAGGVRHHLGMNDALLERWRELILAHTMSVGLSDVAVSTELMGVLTRVLDLLQRRATSGVRVPSVDLRKLHDYIQGHIDQKVTLGDLARVVGLSTTHFSRLFRQHYRMAPIDYLIRKRMMLAGSLLAETTMPLKQVCQRVGYDDVFYFSRLFKKITGMAPSVYRQTIRQQQTDSR